MAIIKIAVETMILKYALALCSNERSLRSNDKRAIRNKAIPNVTKSCVF